jgi:hypothetical protein
MKQALSTSSVEHAWFIDGDEDHCLLELKGTKETGFDIDVQVYPETVMLTAEGWHEHYDATQPLEDFVAEMSGRIRDMLSPAMRIREELSFGVPFRWHLENWHAGEWKTESTTGMFFYPWFGTKTEKLFTNVVLPPRGQHLDFG